MKVLLISSIVCVSIALGLPYNNTDEMSADIETNAEKAGTLLSKLPSILSLTSDWLEKLAKIGSEIDADIGQGIQSGADAVREAGTKIPTNLTEIVKSNIEEGLDVVEDTKDNVINEIKDIQGEVNATDVNVAGEADNFLTSLLNVVKPIVSGLEKTSEN